MRWHCVSGLTGVRGWRVGIMMAALLALGAGARQNSGPDTSTAWFCPMHPEVTASEAGRCPKCGMAMVVGDPFDTREYGLHFSTLPGAVRAGAPVRLMFTVPHPGTGARITKVELG